ncbi:hypothetical protein [Lacinutrix venerupis]|uniref:Uncharacterized protein n=1 Tax=Lacinutrix venerupis TaxID=1486034 RepID=A0AAC9LKZ3_9FLAO|nr:hypothetical protein [Lacinutrix venerupis]APX99306.1 hypothetical protein BWR22_02940 [Lacinutrix venerupis]
MCYYTFIENDKKVYEYRSIDGDSSYFFRFEQKNNNDRTLNLYGIDLKFIDFQNIQFNNKLIKVNKYHYKIVGQEDEESDYYFTSEYGLIMLESTDWSNVNVLINEEEFKPLQDSIRNKKK